MQDKDASGSGKPSKKQSEKMNKTVHRGLKRWGPWRRWSRYREILKEELDRSDFWRDRDAEENTCGRLPDKEGVQVPAIWVAELYTPSTVGGLLAGISGLGWEYGRSRDDSLSKWMREVREGRQAGWTSLGLVSPPDNAHAMGERTALLPLGVRAVLPILISLTPSLTAFVVAFLFDEDVASSLDLPLRAEFKTTICRAHLLRPWHIIRYVLMNSPIRFRHRIFSPDMIRRQAVKSCLQEIETGCVHWVQDHFPGAFASLPGSRIPTAVLLVTEQVRPLSDEAHKIRAFDGLAINRLYDAWEADEWPGARLVLPHGWDDEGNRLSFACRRYDAFPESAGYHDPSSNWTIAQRADRFIRGLLSRWALTCLLDCYHQKLSELRDRTAGDRKYQVVRDLKKLRSLVRTTLYDICACAQEIVEFVESERMYSYDVLKMNYVREVRGGKLELLSKLSMSQIERARQVLRDAVLLKSTLSTSNELSQTISNIRIQILLVLLALMSIAIALWNVFFVFRKGR